MYFLDATSSGTAASKVETDPLGTVVDYSNSYMSGGGSGPTQIGFYGTPQMPNMGCSANGFEADCAQVARWLRDGVAAQCPDNNCGPRVIRDSSGNGVGFAYFDPNAAALGIGTGGVGVGWLPFGTNFVGDGFTGSAGQTQFGMDFVSLAFLNEMSYGGWSRRMAQFQQNQGTPQQAGPQFGLLPGSDFAALANAFFELYARLRNNEISRRCQEEVIDRLTPIGFSLDGFVSYLERGAAFYNGETSQAPIAGTITTQQAANAGFGAGATVASVFARETVVNGQTRRFEALTSITSPSLLMFFRPGTIDTSRGGNNRSNFGRLFHEGLHGYGGSTGGTSLFDQDLEQAFYGNRRGRPSSDFTDYIGQRCF